MRKRYQYGLIMMIIMAIVSCDWEYAGAAQEPPIEFATAFSPAQISTFATRMAIEPRLSSSFAGLALSFDHAMTVAVYQRPHLKVALSRFQAGQEQMLWINDDVMEVDGLAGPPVLAKGAFDGNASPDILFCYTEDWGIGQSATHWYQYLMLFLDGTQQTSSLRLSASDWSSFDEPPYMEGSKGQPASERDTEVLLLPANGTRPCTVILWSRIETYEHSPTNTPDSIAYTIETYQLDGAQFIMTTTETGTSVSTAQTLRKLVEAERAAGTPPLLLDFNKRPTNYLVSDDDWFAWERIGD